MTKGLPRVRPQVVRPDEDVVGAARAGTGWHHGIDLFARRGTPVLAVADGTVLEVGWNDMLMHYRLVRLAVEGLGPCTVGIDAHGRSLYAEIAAKAG